MGMEALWSSNFFFSPQSPFFSQNLMWQIDDENMELPLPSWDLGMAQSEDP